MSVEQLQHTHTATDLVSCKKEMVDSPSAQPPLKRLCDDLRKHFDQFGNGAEGAERVKGMMSEYIETHDDWKEYALYHPAFYARNLVEANEHFELIVSRPLCLHTHVAT
jgi:hypothetical protein